MKGIVLVLCVAMGSALLWSNRSELAAFAEQQGFSQRGAPRVQYVERDPERVYAHVWQHPDWQRMQIEDSRARAERSRAEREYEYAVENGLVPSGRGDVDEALSVHKRLQYLPRSQWPQEWRDRLFRGEDDVRARTTRSRGQADEELVGASDNAPPAWTSKPAGMRPEQRKSVSTSKALSRFIFGVPEEERL
jgi:hypothetical protein